MRLVGATAWASSSAKIALWRNRMRKSMQSHIPAACKNKFGNKKIKSKKPPNPSPSPDPSPPPPAVVGSTKSARGSAARGGRHGGVEGGGGRRHCRPDPPPRRRRAWEVGEGRSPPLLSPPLPRRMGGRGREAAAACAEPAACPSSRPAAHRCRCRIAHRRRGREVAAAHGRSVKGGHRCCRARHCRTGWEVGEGRPLPPVPSPPLTRRSRSPYRAAAAPPHPCLAVGKRERGEKERVRG